MGSLLFPPSLMVSRSCCICDDGVLYIRMRSPFLCDTPLMILPSILPISILGKPPSANRCHYSFPWLPPQISQFYLGWLHFTLPWHHVESFLTTWTQNVIWESLVLKHGSTFLNFYAANVNIHNNRIASFIKWRRKWKWMTCTDE